MKCDELKRKYSDITGPYYGYNEVNEAISELQEENATIQGANDEKAERIVELQKQVDELDGVKKSAELILMNLLDCGLIKEWYFNGKFNAILKADDPHLKIAELKKKLEDVQASHYAESVDAGMRERMLRRALWLARAKHAQEMAWNFHEKNLVEKCAKWDNVHLMCRAKAEEYK